jgi:hypothetical protein
MYYKVIYKNYAVAIIYADSCVMTDQLKFFQGETLVAKIERKIADSIIFYKDENSQS